MRDHKIPLEKAAKKCCEDLFLRKRSRHLRLRLPCKPMEGKPSISEMATDTDSDVTKLKGTKIYVLVEDALIDVLVVSFQTGTKVYQGVLLDVSKKNAPYGIVPPAPEVPKDEENVSSTNNNGGTEEKIDKLYALKQRHTYYQVPPGTQFFFGPYRRNAKDKSVRMRRLRPRKVLCSHCQEVVRDDSNQKRVPGVVTRNTANNNRNLQQQQSNGTNETENGANTGSVANQRIATRSTKLDSSEKNDSASTNTGNIADVKNETTQESTESKSNDLILRSNLRSEKMVLRKRKSTDVESSDSSGASSEKLKRVETLKNETVEVGAGANAASSKQGLAKTSPVIKISFANPQGKDTVLKIPARIKNASDTEEDSNWSLQENSDYSTKNFSSAKAAKKALKKAKKEAQKRAATTATSPTSTTVLSPSNENGDASAAEKEKHHHHKHKVKRKRKHKNGDSEAEKFDLENTDTRNVFNTNGNDGWCLRTSFASDINSSGELNKSANMFEDVKNKCLHQKLSISLKRLNAKAYMRCSPKYSIEEDSVASDVSSTSNVSVCSGSGSDYGDVPDFPKHSSPLRDMDKVKPLMMRISTHNVKKCVLDLGREMCVGDIVWGKIHGFPWWPGKVLNLTISQRDNGAMLNQTAHVSWFGSSTSSYMPCNQLTPFLADFNIRFNKKKRGPYKEAIRQAMNEASKPQNDINELGFTPS
ncbi:PWWP domain-containing protein 2A [Trichonephila inaurata madagascariensis]|uniref:PWWP domain-containing protein 2A n=1 Tax=Trichonephila inaurata madagascariensis TaxID=2747483 RepID=A0A8X6KF81_9ARAC|nr:PWWP domain-containing protein 2A [Trichonephila inaurata madagascariensis]